MATLNIAPFMTHRGGLCQRILWSDALDILQY